MVRVIDAHAFDPSTAKEGVPISDREWGGGFKLKQASSRAEQIATRMASSDNHTHPFGGGRLPTTSSYGTQRVGVTEGGEDDLS